MKEKKAKVPEKEARAKSLLHPDFDGEIVQKPAFRPFTIEDERNGRRRMRGIGKGSNFVESVPNAQHEIFILSQEALGMTDKSRERLQWTGYKNQAGEIIFREKRVPIDPKIAARDLLELAREATFFLTRLVHERPDICREIAATSSVWPVMLDMTEKRPIRAIEETAEKLCIGSDIEGFLRSAKTADENVIRCWATAIYETLFQTRFVFQRASKEKCKYSTTEGCPEWARKTLKLPFFIKSNAGKWASLGREMLLEQLPAFLDSPDLEQKRKSWEHRARNDSRSGRVSMKAIQREAFDDFAKELKALAPEKNIYRGEW